MKLRISAGTLSEKVLKTSKYLLLFTYSVILILFTATFAIEMLSPLFSTVLGEGTTVWWEILVNIPLILYFTAFALFYIYMMWINLDSDKRSHNGSTSLR